MFSLNILLLLFVYLSLDDLQLHVTGSFQSQHFYLRDVVSKDKILVIYLELILCFMSKSLTTLLVLRERSLFGNDSKKEKVKFLSESLF